MNVMYIRHVQETVEHMLQNSLIC